MWKRDFLGNRGNDPALFVPDVLDNLYENKKKVASLRASEMVKSNNRKVFVKDREVRKKEVNLRGFAI